jgi:hypothetical protein
MRHVWENLVMYAVLYPDETEDICETIDDEPVFRLKHFVVTDLSSDHLPWKYIVEKGIYMEKVASCDLLTPDFLRGEPFPIYLTSNLWTCQCREGGFIHDVDFPFCISCKTCYHKMKKLMDRPGMGQTWRASTDHYPYWHDLSGIASRSPVTA